MSLSSAIEKLEKIERMTRNLKIPDMADQSPEAVDLVAKLTKILRNEDKASITIAVLIGKLIDKYEGRAV